MTSTPFAHAESLRIGTVDFVSPDEVKVLLDIEAPESVALNAGGVRPFPRVNGYVLMPVDGAYLVGQIEWITVERSAFPKRRGVQDFGLIDLPYPLRRMRLNALGTLCMVGGEIERYAFRRGADVLPSIGTPVMLPTERQLRSIVESGEGRHVRLGVSPLAGNAEVRFDPDRLFGRHTAVLGNTGSGKSCSVAGLIRWSLEAARASRKDEAAPNARFIVLDPNGEYARAFSGENETIRATVFRVDNSDSDTSLQVPLWFWNSSEWASFTHASAKTQRPLLKRALRDVRAGRIAGTRGTEETDKLALRRYLSVRIGILQREISSGAILTDRQFGSRVKTIRSEIESKLQRFPGQQLEAILEALTTAIDATYNPWTNNQGKLVEQFRPFSEQQVQSIIAALATSMASIDGDAYQEGPDEDVPLPFSGVELADHLQLLADGDGVSQYVDLLVSRIRTILSDRRIDSVIGGSAELTLEHWLEEYVGGASDSAPHLAILDLSLVPTEVVHVVTAVAARMIFEALQRYRRSTGTVLPTVLVMEEAHTFVKRYKDDVESHDAASVCCQVFERIAREGRKFGLGLLLSSQRPSELSPTVLSQCNTFLLHRISNDRDQDLVRKLLPDSLHGLLRELPSLPSQYAVLLGWASALPVLVRVDDLPRGQRPQSDDPDFWSVWTGRSEDEATVERAVNWKAIADEWQGRAKTEAAPEEQAVQVVKVSE